MFSDLVQAPAPSIPIRSAERAAEIAWFSALCSDDYEYLGVPDGKLRSSVEHCMDIVKRADELGYQNILHPSGWAVGPSSYGFAFAMATLTKQINQLVALRMGELYPPMLARSIATLDHLSKGRLTLNIISSDLPGQKIDGELRYERSEEVLQILRKFWTEDEVEFHGQFFDFPKLNAAPAKPYQQNGGPLLYFGGISPAAQKLCARQCDVFLMWPETTAMLRETMWGMSQQAASFGRTLDFGLRIHVIVRETEAEAKAYARRLVSRLDDSVGQAIKNRSQDSKSVGVERQNVLRAGADDEGYIEDHIWSGIGRARSGCGSAIVGDPDQVYKKLQAYMDLGIRSFILSGYPHLEECDLFAKYVLPRMKTTRFNAAQSRMPSQLPVTPMTIGPRV